MIDPWLVIYMYMYTKTKLRMVHRPKNSGAERFMPMGHAHMIWSVPSKEKKAKKAKAKKVKKVKAKKAKIK